MVELNCPLCCNETFPSSTSLKCHILNVLDKLECPSCHLKFDRLTELAEHLDTCPHDDPKTNERENELHEGIILDIKVEEPQYYCHTCDAHISDLEGHLRCFHEEIILVKEEDGVGDHNANEESIFIISPTKENNNGDDMEAPANNFKPGRKNPNTISQENFKDKERSLCTGKFSEINQFRLQIDTFQSEDVIASTIETKCSNCNVYFYNLDLYKNHKCMNSEELKCSDSSVTYVKKESGCVHLNMSDLSGSGVRRTRYCKYPACKNSYCCNSLCSKVKFHRFPRDPHTLQAWKKICNIPENVSCLHFYMCANHFRDSDYINCLRQRLKFRTVPVLPTVNF